MLWTVFAGVVPWRRENRKDPDAGERPRPRSLGAPGQGASEEETRYLATRASRIAAVWTGLGPEPYGQRFTEIAHQNIP